MPLYPQPDWGCGMSQAAQVSEIVGKRVAASGRERPRIKRLSGLRRVNFEVVEVADGIGANWGNLRSSLQAYNFVGRRRRPTHKSWEELIHITR